NPVDSLPKGDNGAAAYLIETSRLIDPDRYVEVRGTPYRYKEFRKITLYDATLNEYPLERANLNGFTSQFEYYAPDGQIRELNPANFLRAEVALDDGSKHIYGRGINPKFRDRYAQIVHRGDYITCTMVYDVKNDEKVVQDVGRTLKLRRFSAKSLYFAMVDGDFVTMKMTAKNVAEDLGFKAELLKFIKSEKLKVSDDDDLIRVLEKAETLFE
ncbi:MAG: hypothetical protein AAF840_03845, partial [Bacteroidota bacterium]